MIEDLLPLLPVSQAALWTGFVVFMRVSGMMAVLPAFGDQSVPMRVRLTLAIMFTFIVAPSVDANVAPMPDDFLRSAAIWMPETLVGLFFGIFLRFFILALQIGGAIAAQSTSSSQIFGGSAGVDPQPAIGHVLVVSGTALAALSGLHVQAAAYMIHSYAMVPVGAGLDPETVSTIGVSEVSRAFGLGFTLAAPFLIASLIYNVVLGVINRAMPQLMVSFVGAPAITAGGLILLLLTAPVILSVWMLSFERFMHTPFGAWP